MGAMRNSNKISVGKPEGKRTVFPSVHGTIIIKLILNK
jgi:hypothetical protein